MNRSKQRSQHGAAHAGDATQYVISLAPGDAIGFRHARSRKTYWTSITLCHELAVQQTAAATKSNRRKRRS